LAERALLSIVGMAIAAIVPMMAITIISSIRVNPLHVLTPACIRRDLI
jgi:hypothetical protein